MTKKHLYCTYFDSGYLARGLALIESLRQNGDDAPIWVLALDDATKTYLDAADLPGVHTLVFADIENSQPRLSPLRASRSRMEYVFTSTPLLIRWVMQQSTDPESVVIYLDADMYFFRDPQLVLDAMADGSVGIIEHRYSPALATRLAKYGRFNVGWVGFRADDRGKRCLEWWGTSTLDWCFDSPKDGKYADQGYLNEFPEKFEGVAILEPLGLDLAPWNTARHDIRYSAQSGVTVDGDPLVFFHFHGIERRRERYITSQLVYGARLTTVLRERVYVPYLRRLTAFTDLVAASPLIPGVLIAPRGKGVRAAFFRIQKAILRTLAIATGNAIHTTTLEE